jgi:hypothetical protein
MNRTLLGALLFAAAAALSYFITGSVLVAETPYVVQPTAASTPQTVATSTVQAHPTTSNEKRFSAYTTGYTYWDNTPPGSSIIAFSKSDGFPTARDGAGGTGTYSDPITVAVGHVIVNGEDIPDYKPGTRFYIPNFRRYFIVEDTCGDGDTPQNGPCHKNIDRPGFVQLDLWLGGASGTKEQTDACAASLTEVHLVIQNPEPAYAVMPGELFQNGACTQQYGDAVALK